MVEVRVYSTPKCPFCEMTKEFLDEKGVEFVDIDVSADREAAREMISKSRNIALPQVEINGKVIVGFNKEVIEEELAKYQSA